MQAIGGTDTPTSTSTHNMHLYARTLSGEKVAAVVRMAFSAKSGVTLKISARSESANAAADVAGGIA